MHPLRSITRILLSTSTLYCTTCGSSNFLNETASYPNGKSMIIQNEQFGEEYDENRAEYRTRRESARIVNGWKVGKGKFPWFARATKNNFKQWAGCGGVLISPEFVLTAGHCVNDSNAFKMNGGYEIGSLCTNSDNNCGQKREKRSLSEYFIHPNYLDRRWSIRFDFALVKLDAPSNISYAVMDQGDVASNFKWEGKSLLTIGFGRNKFSYGYFPEHLMQTEVGYVPNKKCRSRYNNGHIFYEMICAARRGRDACSGDSGGPLIDRKTGVVIGLVSWGWGCASQQYPGVYARISAVWPWIHNTVCQNSVEAPDFC